MSNSTASELDRLIGLGSAKRLIMRLARGDLGTHAILLYGTAGSGKQHLSTLLAQAWLCQNPGAEGADGSCRACQTYERGTNADFLLVAPQGASRIIVRKQISNDNVKEGEPTPLLEFFRTLPVASKHRVALIEDAHRMNASSANSLLKTLEEPHPHGKLILTTDSVGSVLPTILSRCLAVVCELPSEESLRTLAPNVSEDLIRMSDGAPGRVLAAVQNPEAYERIAAFARSLFERPRGGALVAAEDFRQICELLAAKNGSGVRVANALAVELLATYLAREPAAPAEWTQAAVDSHRRIVGNVGAPIVFDALFASILTERGF
ncbi:MAG: ATP-binding protein [Fimbriimonas sp.]